MLCREGYRRIRVFGRPMAHVFRLLSSPSHPPVTVLIYENSPASTAVEHQYCWLTSLGGCMSGFEAFHEWTSAIEVDPRVAAHLNGGETQLRLLCRCRGYNLPHNFSPLFSFRGRLFIFHTLQGRRSFAPLVSMSRRRLTCNYARGLCY